MDLQKQRIIFYDGYCILCSRFIQFLIKRDQNNLFNFKTLDKLPEYDLITSKYKMEDLKDSMVYASDSKLYFYSDAIIQTLADLGGPWKMIGIFHFIPKKIRDYFYKMIARNRYRIFGKSTTCLFPDELLKSGSKHKKRFIK